MRKTALVIGASGQDGSYLCEILDTKGYRVVGVRRGSSAVGVEHCEEVATWAMTESETLKSLLIRYTPDEVYNVAGYATGAGMFDGPVDMGNINGLAVTRILDAILSVSKETRFVQACSSEMYGEALESPQNEETPFRPISPYGAAKLFAYSMVNVFRRSYGLFACSAVLFNHESPRRRLDFVTRKIATGAAKIKLGIANELVLGDLDARRDWGFAGDYARAMWKMLQADTADDYVLATGETHSVRDFCRVAFSHLGLKYEDHVRTDPRYFRRRDGLQLVGDATKARQALAWAPSVSFDQLVTMMVDADMRTLGHLV